MPQWTHAAINAEGWPDEALADLRSADLLVLRLGCTPRIASAKVAPETASLSAVLETDRRRRGRSRDSGRRLQNQQRHGEQPGKSLGKGTASYSILISPTKRTGKYVHKNCLIYCRHHDFPLAMEGLVM